MSLLDTPSARVSLQWCGGPTFAVRYRGISFYMEPGAAAGPVTGADMLTVGGRTSLDVTTLQAILAASPHAKMVLPKGIGEQAHALGLDYHRMTTTDAALRVEYFKNGEYGRIYGVPAARRDEQGEPQLDYTPIGGFPRIGFMARFGSCTVFHSGRGVPYAELADRLRPYSPNVAIVSIGPETFTEAQAADLAEQLQLPWLVPAPATPALGQRFLDHMLGHRPLQRFKMFEPGETWEIPGMA